MEYSIFEPQPQFDHSVYNKYDIEMKAAYSNPTYKCTWYDFPTTLIEQ